MLHWSREVVAGLLGSRLLSHAILLIRAPDCCPVVVDWWKGQVRGCCAKQVRRRVQVAASTISYVEVSGLNGISIN